MNRNLILIFSILLGLTSCSSNYDDDAESEKLVGNWLIVDVYPESFYDPTACIEDSSLLFTKDNVVNSYLHDADNDCAVIQNTGSWEYKGNSIYSINLPLLGPTEGTVQQEFINTIKYSTSSIEGFPNGVSLTLERI